MGKNQSKAKEKAKEALTPAEINALVISTKLTPEEIIKWHTGIVSYNSLRHEFKLKYGMFEKDSCLTVPPADCPKKNLSKFTKSFSRLARRPNFAIWSSTCSPKTRVNQLV